MIPKQVNERKNEMERKEVMGVFEMLARSQGLYGRLLRNLNAREAAGEDLTPFFDQFKGCKDAVDVVMVVEC